MRALAWNGRRRTQRQLLALHEPVLRQPASRRSCRDGLVDHSCWQWARSERRLALRPASTPHAHTPKQQPQRFAGTCASSDAATSGCTWLLPLPAAERAATLAYVSADAGAAGVCRERDSQGVGCTRSKPAPASQPWVQPCGSRRTQERVARPPPCVMQAPTFAITDGYRAVPQREGAANDAPGAK